MSTGRVIIQTREIDDTTLVDLRVNHPMEPGSRKDKQGVVIPSWYMTHLDVFHDDVKITSLELGPLVSRNPTLSLSLKGAKQGEIIKVTWEDNRGKSGEHSAEIA